jgi:cell division protease FtsH
MVTEYGMSDRLGLVSYERSRQPMFLPGSSASGKSYSETKAAEIDEEVARFMEDAHQRVRKILSERRPVLDDLAHLLSIQESVQGEELRTMLPESMPGPAPPPRDRPSRDQTGKGKDENEREAEAVLDG